MGPTNGNGSILRRFAGVTALALALALVVSYTLSVPLSIVLLCIPAFEIWMLKRNIVAPIRVVSARMREFAQGDVHDVEPLEVGRNDEVGEIAASFNQMVVDVEHYVDRIEDMAQERVATETELEVAKRIQQGLVPAKKQVEGPGFEACGFARAARMVGGDYYDLFALGDGRIALVVGDVSGKGISAAMAMAMTMAIMHEKLQNSQDPAGALNATNETMLESNPECMFATVLAAIYDPVSCVLTYANAGHTPPLVVGGEYLEPDPGTVLGLFEDAGIVNERMRLEPGMGVLVYTDGATEAIDGNRDFFGKDRLCEAVRDASTAEDAVKAAVRAIDAFAGDAEQFDDLTLAALFASVPDRRWEATLSPELSSFAMLCDHVVDACGGKKSRVARRAMLACDEAFANIVSYSGATAVEAVVERVGGRVMVRLLDDGTPFNPLEHDAGERAFEALELGGMGVAFVKESCDELSYSYEGGRNALTMTFVL